MDVGVDEAGRDVTPFQVQDLPGFVAFPQTGDQAAGDGDLRRVHLAGEDVDQAGVAQQQVGGLVAAGDGKEPGQIHVGRISLLAPILTPPFPGTGGEVRRPSPRAAPSASRTRE